MMQDIYRKKDLMEALKKAGLPWSYKSILHFEEIGLFERSKNHTGNRLYTGQEIEEIVQKVAVYKRSKNGDTTK